MCYYILQSSVGDKSIEVHTIDITIYIHYHCYTRIYMMWPPFSYEKLQIFQTNYFGLALAWFSLDMLYVIA